MLGHDVTEPDIVIKCHDDIQSDIVFGCNSIDMSLCAVSTLEFRSIMVAMCNTSNNYVKLKSERNVLALSIKYIVCSLQ